MKLENYWDINFNLTKIIYVIALLFLFSSFARAETWSAIPESRYQFEADSITKNNGHLYFVWVSHNLTKNEINLLQKQLSKKTANDLNRYSYSIDRMKIDCKKKLIGLGSQYMFSTENNVISSVTITVSDETVAMHSVPPGIDGYKILNAICRSQAK